MEAIDDQVREAIRSMFSALEARSLALRSEPVVQRKNRLRQLKHWIHGNLKQLADAAYADLRKPEVEFNAIEILYLLNEIRSALENLDRWTKPKPVDASFEMLGTRSEIRFEPKGVCLIIAPWNYPFSLCIGPLVSAIAAGNCAVLKPSELTPHVSNEINRMVTEVFDPSVVRVMQGGPEISRELLTLPFDHIFFTGSPAVGKLVMKAAAENLTSVTLELGGKSPAIVTKTARIDDTARRIVVSKFANAGQTCVAPDYVLADEQIAEKLVGRLEHFTHHSFSNKTAFPRIVSRKHFERLNELMRDAIEKGSSVLVSDADESTNSFFPTILTNVPLTTRVMQEEIFGPILPIVTYEKLDEAIEFVNNMPKALGLYLFSQSNNERESILSHTSSGGVCVNDCAIQFLHHHLPFGGVNTSGIGKSHGHYGFLAFSNEKPVLKQRNGITSVSVLYPPHSAGIQKLLNRFIKLFRR